MKKDIQKYHILDALGEAVFILNREYKVVFWNSVIEGWTNISRDEIIGKKITDFYKKFNNELYVDRIDQIFNGGPPSIFSLNLHKDLISCKTSQGKPRIQHSMLKPIDGDKDNEIHALFSITDVSSLTERISEIRNVNKQNILEIEKRKVVEAELLKAREEALILAQHKSEFLANMSHEIRTPLNAILGMGEVLSEFEVGSEYDRYLGIQRNASKNLLNLINDILDLSKIDAGQMSIEEIPVDLYSCAKESLELLKFSANQKNTILNLDYKDDTPKYFFSDPNRLSQIFLNILNNAIKFTENGEVKILISRDYKKETNNILLEVRDSGKGISKRKLATIFEAFSQESKSTSRKFGGTGLGLTITRKLVSILEGEIWVESEENIGSSFFVSIPMKEDIKTKESNLKLKSKKKIAMEKTTDTKLEVKKILIAEDTLDNQDLIKAFLKSSVHKITFANNGLEAINLYKSHQEDASPFDLIFMDIQMPECDGYEATKVIREYEKEKELSETPIIALSAYSMASEVQKSLNSGCNSHLSKPISKKDLIKAIDETTYEETKKMAS